MDSRIFRRAFLLYLSGTRGGFMRLRIIRMLMQKPLNVNEISKHLSVDYKTAEHHIRVLEKNGFVSSSGRAYADAYVLSPLMRAHKDIVEEVISDLGKSR